MAIFVDRVAELPRLLDALQYHPEGLRIDDLAVEVGRTPDQVREALFTYYTTDLALYDADLVGRPPAIEFVTGARGDDDLGRASDGAAAGAGAGPRARRRLPLSDGAGPPVPGRP